MNKPLPVQQYIPQQTIQSYLDALLQDASSELLQAEQAPVAEAEATQIDEVKVEPLAAEPAVEEKPRVAARLNSPARPVLKEVVQASPAAEPAPTVEQDPVQGQLEPQPQWREQAFEALLFDVAGLTLAVPLVSLGTIHALDAEITPLFGQPDWFLGILPTAGGNLKVLDTARWVMPERYNETLREGLRFVISVEGYDWGLAVHGVSRSIKLTPDQVKWRSQQGKRPWLAGTVIDQMCALVDVAALAGMIASGQGEHEKGKRNGKAGRALV